MDSLKSYWIFKSPTDLRGKILDYFSCITAEYLLIQVKLRMSVMIAHIFS